MNTQPQQQQQKEEEEKKTATWYKFIFKGRHINKTKKEVGCDYDTYRIVLKKQQQTNKT
jgi:hypothetical protein